MKSRSVSGRQEQQNKIVNKRKVFTENQQLNLNPNRNHRLRAEFSLCIRNKTYPLIKA